MNQRFLSAQLLSLMLVGVGGCSRSESGPNPQSATELSGESVPAGGTEIQDAVIDPEVDAGMMADEFERNHRGEQKVR
ncbi:hypothetical protein FHS27_003716 [Rhodopirellula rubra]|uniref:Uncharacterized protein n=1 Tax=Aporhodopirellula rubra TaxID=980271 RepID=A0A7W5E170_9BACT|nr:hypothetical protein [Aporhodopirellula rubra]MBB3207889.1 hypothetical protein [Aporhodopirellula rubra]